MAVSQVLRYVLAAEFALGGQARVTSALTPSINHFVLSKSDGFFRHLHLIPGHDGKQKTQILGAVMCVAAALFAVPARRMSRGLRLSSVILGGTLSTILLVGEATIQGDVWLPTINIAFAGWLAYVDI